MLQRAATWHDDTIAIAKALCLSRSLKRIFTPVDEKTKAVKLTRYPRPYHVKRAGDVRGERNQSNNRRNWGTGTLEDDGAGPLSSVL
jgi:hypothetical protein